MKDKSSRREESEMPKLEKITLGIKAVLASFMTFMIMGAGYSNLQNADAATNIRLNGISSDVQKEVTRLDGRIDSGEEEVGSYKKVMATAVTEIAVIQQKQEQAKERDEEQFILLREILKNQRDGRD